MTCQINKLSFLILFSIIAINPTWSQTDCSGVGDLLNHGYLLNMNIGNFDEFAILHSSEFFVKIDKDVPRRSFPKNHYHNGQLTTGFYMSYDTDGQCVPIAYNVAANQWHSVTTFTSDGFGYRFNIFPPSNNPPFQSIADFIANFDGTKHITAWETTFVPNPWKTWSDFVSGAVQLNTTLKPNGISFDFNIIGSNTPSPYTNQEYIIDIHGGWGVYKIEWQYIMPNGTMSVKEVHDPSVNLYADKWIINNTDYFIYKDGFTKFTLPYNRGQYQIVVSVTAKHISGDNTKDETKIHYKNVPEGQLEKSIDGTELNSQNYSYKLYDAYPNPFNPTTMIRFNIPQDSYVQLNVYNAIGQVVKTLIDKELSAALHTVEFDASDLPSGLYYYQVIAYNFTETKKMLLIK